MEIVRKRKVKPEKNNDDRKSNHRRTTACLELSTKHLYRRAFSEVSLLDACGSFDFKEGHSYHFITAGDVDSLSYLKAILRSQSLGHCLLSTWCMAAEDILQLQEWVRVGKIKTLDIYVGEIFPTTYKIEFKMLVEMYEQNSMGGVDWRSLEITPKYTQELAINLHSALKPRQMLIPTREQRMGA